MTFKDARNLILLFRFKSYVKTAFILLEELQSQDIHIKTLVCNIIAKKTLSIILMICAIIMLLIKDCIQDIMILKDDIFKKMFHADWINIIAFKTLNFHNLFILLSSFFNSQLFYSSFLHSQHSRLQQSSHLHSWKHLHEHFYQLLSHLKTKSSITKSRLNEIERHDCWK